jgi:hypothetical protein
MSQSSEPLLGSCDYTLHDKPATLPYVEAAKQSGLARGLIQQSDILNLGMRLISDDPFNPEYLLVTLQVGEKGSPIGGPGTPVLMSSHNEVAVIDKTSREVQAMAEGYWY